MLRGGRRGSAAFALLAVMGGVLPVNPGVHHASAASMQTVVVPANAVHGVYSQPLVALATYRIVARGVIGYGVGDSDAECSAGPTNAVTDTTWVRDRYPFMFAADPENLVHSDFWDPDPSDDAPDLYVDHKNVDWLPLNEPPTATGCDSGHAYQTWFMPIESRPVNFAVFDVAYPDNRGSFTVTIEEVRPPLPGASDSVHTETVLVHAADTDGSTTASLLAGHDYLFIAHGSYIYDARDYGNVADTECSRTATDPTYLRHRTVTDAFDVVVNGEAIEWHGIGPETDVPGAQGCSWAHEFWVNGQGHGVPITLSISDPNPGDNAGTLSIDVFRLD